ncbi:hypothetical protein HNY73_010974 [Argiope bruennichi]|uniref:Uncharacterized protein n=1 Tax=Argiope bruennichi TaxID=94029 RepID=A0A8T0F7M5_ARGBR|nr:hypothetical protein HNY73_010974 [Argiope bruennichi]
MKRVTRLKTFVANRVAIIQETTELNQWHHVPSEQNPVDVISRGLDPTRMQQSDLWWFGPTFLQELVVNFPGQCDGINDPLDSSVQNRDVSSRKLYLAELKNPTNCCLISAVDSSFLDNILKSRSLDWKICFKKILAPHLLNTTNMEEQNDAPHPLNAYNGEEQNGVQDNTKRIISSTRKEFHQSRQALHRLIIELNHSSRLFVTVAILTYPGRETVDSENDEEEEIAKIVAADAEELAKNFKILKCKKTDSTHNPPKWKHAFKKVLDPTYFLKPTERPVTPLTLEELDGDYNPLEDDDELSACSVSENCDEEDSEMKSTENTSSSPKRPKKVPPPGGFVCVNKITAKDLLKRPPIIPSEGYWDDDLIW